MKNEYSSFDKLRTKSKILVLIDSNAIIHRAYHALPKNMSTSTGELTNAVYGYSTTLIKVLEDLKPDYIAASFDISRATFRVEQYTEYKAHRVAADQELYDQIPKVRELLDVLNIPVYEQEGFEADDCIGTIVNRIQNADNRKQLEHKLQRDSGSQAAARNDKFNNNSTIQQSNNLSVYIVTGDKDLFQLIDGNIFVYSLKKGLSQMEIVDRKVIKEEWNLDPEDFIDLKALAGDASDNIPGVPGIGGVTATKLLQQFDTLENLYERIEAVIPEKSGIQKNTDIDSGSQVTVRNDNAGGEDDEGKSKADHSKEILDEELNIAAKDLNIKPRILRLLIENKDQAFLSQKLATIHKDVPMEFDLEKCQWGEYDREKLKEFFEKMQFFSLLRRFGAESGKREVKTEKAKQQQKKDEQLKLL